MPYAGVDEPVPAVIADHHVLVLQPRWWRRSRCPTPQPSRVRSSLPEGELRVFDGLRRGGECELHGPLAAPLLLRAQAGRPPDRKSHSAAICERNGDGSKNEIRRMAGWPDVMSDQNASRPLPPGATTPDAGHDAPTHGLHLRCHGTHRLTRLRLGVHVTEFRAWRQRSQLEDRADQCVPPRCSPGAGRCGGIQMPSCAYTRCSTPSRLTVATPSVTKRNSSEYG